MWKKIAIAVTVILAMYAFVPMVVIDFIGKFAIGWMLMDIINQYVKEEA